MATTGLRAHPVLGVVQRGLPLAWTRVRRLPCSVYSGDCPGHGDLMVSKTVSSGIPQNVSILEGKLIVSGLLSALSVVSSPSSRVKGRVLVAVESRILSEALRVEEFREARTVQCLWPVENLLVV